MKITRSLAVAGLLSSAAPALAAPIIYTGFQQVGSIAASYTITTDGTIGQLVSDNSVLGFSVTLSDAIGSFQFDQTSGRRAFSFFTASATELSFQGSGIVGFSSNATGVGGRLLGQLQVGRDFQQAQISTGGQIRNDNSFNSVTTFASVVPLASAVPEPATWGMMIAGFGAVGFAMRRRAKVSTTVRFA